MNFTHNPKLMNSGVTCYMNSSFQCMFYTVPLIISLATSTCCKHGLNEFCTLEAFMNLFKMCMVSRFQVYPLPFIKNLKKISSSLQYRRQEDAHEFLISFLDRLNECTENENHIRTVFGGCYVSKLQCFNCRYSSLTTTQELMLVLDICNIKSLEEALNSYTKIEKIEGRCECCKSNKRAKRTKIRKVPEVMFFQLSRFSMLGNKLHNKVEYPLKLELRPYMANLKKEEQTEYYLYAVLVHSGSTVDEGHYYSYVRSSPRAWHLKNDNISYEVTEAEVLDQCAYLLFYVKKGFHWFSNLKFALSSKQVQPCVVKHEVIGIRDINDNYSHVAWKRLFEDLYNWTRQTLMPPTKRLKNDDNENDDKEVNVDAKNL